MKKKLLYIICVVIGWGALSSCSSSFLKEYSQDLGRVQSVTDLQELLVGDCLMPKALFSNDYSYYQVNNPNFLMLHFMSDELQENFEVSEDNDGTGYRSKMFPYFTWQQDLFMDENGKNTNESDEASFWNLAYQKINNCNMVLVAADELESSSAEETAQVNKVKGELYYLRASYYFMLVNLYGKPYSPATAPSELAVPVKTSENVEDKEYQRASVADVYAQIASDLKQAEDLLLDASAPQSIYHPGLEAVYVLRSRIALYMQDWQVAADYAQKAVDKNSFLFDLTSFPSTQYPISKSNGEVVFSNGASCLGNVLFNAPQRNSYADNSTPTWCISDDLYGLYGKDDKRRTTYITTEDDLFNQLPTYHKVDCSRSSYGVYKEVSDVFSIRTAEAYLNLAEAEAELGHDAQACEWLNKLRGKRINGAADVQLSGEELVNFIRDERERELCLEGHRWFDLRRYTVDEKYPYSKEIVHTMSTFKSENWQEYRSNLKKYRLEKNDGAYTLNIPKEERDFQPSIGSYVRPVRNAFESQDFAAGDGDEDYEDW